MERNFEKMSHQLLCMRLFSSFPSSLMLPLVPFTRSLESFESNASPTTTVADKWLLIKVKHTWNNNTSCSSSKHTCTSGLATAFIMPPPHVQKQHF